MNGMDFEIKRESLYESVAKKLEEMILKENSDLPKKLPSEHALAASFDVSLPVIRQALVLLRERGVVVSKNGDGSYISEPSPEKLSETITRFSRAGNISPLDVFTVRMSLERTSARLAAENINEEELKELRELNQKMRETDGTMRAELDALFHRKIAEASGNTLLSMFVSSLGSALVPMFERAAAAKDANKKGCDGHDGLIALLASHDAEGAEELIREHLLYSMRNYEMGDGK